MTTQDSTTRYMHMALAMAGHNLGKTWPNPSVGAVVVKDGVVIGTGCTARGGRPHAEPQAIAQAGESARGATLYVTLEPCSHHGKTSPCTDAIIKAGIARCVVACRDPNPQVNGSGVVALRQAGIEVIEGVCEEQALRANEGFFSVMNRGRPWVGLKIATSADGKITYPDARKQWITGEQSRAYGHMLRSRYDAIATGIGTVLADDPQLTCRLPGLSDCSPVRVVFDRVGRLPAGSQLVRTAGEVPLWVVNTKGLFRLQGKDMALAPLTERTTDNIGSTLEILAAQGITRLLVEAGQGLSTVFINSGLVDRLYWFRAPLTIGAGGMDAVSGGLEAYMAKNPAYIACESLILGEDRLDIYERAG